MRDLLARYLDGELDEAEAARLLRAIDEDPAAEQALRSHEALLEAAERLPAHTAPPGFADRVMRGLGGTAAVAGSRVERRRVRPRWPAAAAALVAGLLLGHFVPDRWPAAVTSGIREPDAIAAGRHVPEAAVVVVGAEAAGPGVEYRRAVRLVYAGSRPDLRSVAVAGSFNGWDPTRTRMVRDEHGWSLLLVLPPGEHEYMYVEDGETWVTDPEAPRTRPDGFGGSNGVLHVRA